MKRKYEKPYLTAELLMEQDILTNSAEDGESGLPEDNGNPFVNVVDNHIGDLF